MTSSERCTACILTGHLVCIIQAEKCGGAVEADSANLYYSPAEREDELYQQLKKQRIKSIPSSHIKYVYILHQLTQSILHGILCPPENLAFSDLVNLGLSAKANGSMLTRN